MESIKTPLSIAIQNIFDTMLELQCRNVDVFLFLFFFLF